MPNQFKKELLVNSRTYSYYDISTINRVHELPFSIKILLENIIRKNSDANKINSDIKALIDCSLEKYFDYDIEYYPSRVLMQDFTGVPAVVDLACMRDAMNQKTNNAEKINPLIPVDLVIDHSVMVDFYQDQDAFEKNVKLEYERNLERYEFLKWGQKSFKNLRVVPPGTGICHQVNLEYLAKVVWLNEEENLLYPDTVVGTDSHTTMINGLSVLGWGVGGIEAEACMLGKSVSMLIPEVIGMKLKNSLKEGVSSTDMVLHITNILRSKGVVGKFVEFYGDGVSNLSLADRATIANMAPEYGATCGFFAIDDKTLEYLRLTGRSDEQIEIVKAYAKAQGLWSDNHSPKYINSIELDLSSIEPCVAGPKRPQDKIFLKDVKLKALELDNNLSEHSVKNKNYSLKNHDVVLAAITSCTNTSNPSAMIGAGLLAKKASLLGLRAKDYVKTSFAPGSQAVSAYLENANLMKYLKDVGFNLVGYGCTTCIGNSGSLDKNIVDVIEENNLIVSGVLSGNRNFEGRIHQNIKANYLASPAFVIAYAIAGSTVFDFSTQAIGKDKNNKDVFLKDIWPSSKEINETISQFLTVDIFKKKYQNVFDGDSFWQEIKVEKMPTYNWKHSTYIKKPPYFELKNHGLSNIENANILAIFGDSITTDHISPAGSIKVGTPAAKFLQDNGVEQKDFNSYGARRGNDDVMVRGTFANIRLKNEILNNFNLGDISGGYTIDFTKDTLEKSFIYDTCINYAKKDIPLIVFAGKEYGTGSSRDWAAKGSRLLGIRAIIAKSFERIHRSNLVGMGIIPFEFINNEDAKTLNIKGDELISIEGLNNNITPKAIIDLIVKDKKSKNVIKAIKVKLRIDTNEELEYVKANGILPYVLNSLT